MTRFVNLTARPIIVLLENNREISIPPSGEVARLNVQETYIPAFHTKLQGTHNVPDPVTDTILVTSTMVRRALANRLDITSPAQIIRDSQGTVVGCRGLVFNRESDQGELCV